MHEAPGKLPRRRLWLVIPLILLMFGSLPLFSRIVAFAIVMIFCFLPFMFCKLRYTTGRCKLLREHSGKIKPPK